MTYLVEQVRARCARKSVRLADRRTIKARVDHIDRRTVALKRKDLKGVKATKAVPGQYVVSRPLEVVQIDHTQVDIFLVDEKTRKTMDKRPWLTLAIDVFTRMVVGFHLSMDKPSRVSFDPRDVLFAIHLTLTDSLSIRIRCRNGAQAERFSRIRELICAIMIGPIENSPTVAFRVSSRR